MFNLSSKSLSAENYYVSSKYMLYDFIIASLFLFISVSSHIIAFPLYIFDPIKISVVLILLLSNKNNALIFSITLPVISFIISGHPVFPKFIIIIIENTTLVYLFHYISMINNTNRILALNFSIVFVKTGYYLIKYSFIRLSLMQGDYISKPLLYQLFPIIIINILFILCNLPKKGDKSGIH